MKKTGMKKTSFSELRIDKVDNKFSFITRAGKKILAKKMEEKGQPTIDAYIDVLSDMLQKEIK